MWQDSKSQIVEEKKVQNLKLLKKKKSNCEKKIKLWQNSKTLKVTVVMETVVTEVLIVTSLSKNPAYGRHQLSRFMRIVGPIPFWRGRVIYRSALKSGLGPCENADSVHAKVGTRSTQKCWLGSLRNTSPFLGLYSRSRSRLNSGTHPRF